MVIRRRFRRRFRRPVRRFRRRFRRRAGLRTRRRYMKFPRFFRNKRRMRKYNQAKLDLNRILASGDSLPQLAFGQLRYTSGPFAISFAPAAGGGAYTVNSAIQRTICMNTMYRPVIRNPPFGDPYTRYFGIYNLFYKRYMVIGSKLSLTLTPQAWPRVNRWGNPDPEITAQANVTGDNPYQIDSTSASSGPMIQNIQTFWYIRVWNVDVESTSDPKQYTPISTISGHPMYLGNNSSTNPLWQTDMYQDAVTGDKFVPWYNMADFLGDRTVTYTRDWRRFQTGFSEDLLPGSEGPVPYIRRNASASVGRSATTLVYKFSCKKNFKDKNILDDKKPYWLPLDPHNDAVNVAYPMRACYVRWGTIGFRLDDGSPIFHHPMPYDFSVTHEIKYYTAFRSPRSLDSLSGKNADLFAKLADMSRRPDNTEFKQLILAMHSGETISESHLADLRNRVDTDRPTPQVGEIPSPIFEDVSSTGFDSEDSEPDFESLSEDSEEESPPPSPVRPPPSKLARTYMGKDRK